MTVRNILWLVACASLALLNVKAIGQPSRLAGDQEQLKRVLDNYHFSPRAVDDAFSMDVFEHFIHVLDPNKLYFTADDIASLGKYRPAISTDWSSNHQVFATAATGILTKALASATANLNAASRERIQWQVADRLPRKKSLTYAQNDAALKERWRQWIKFRVLEEIGVTMPVDSPRVRVTIARLLEKEPDVRRRVAAAEARAMQQMTEVQGGLAGKVNNVFLTSVAAAFDPHSLYLSPVESENFVGAITSQSYSFGLELKEEVNGNLAIERLVPGGPAWKSGVLHTGDVLFSVKPENKELINVEGIGIDSLGILLDRNNHLSIELTVKTESGERKTAKLRKEKMEDAGNIVKGAVLHGKNKIGYISLPGFYAEWGSEQGSSCANDMARQILKMKKENIEGLIVDIRSNGGGSVLEAIELAGIFIDQGPLAIFKNRNGTLTTLKDVNRGTIYDGPLVLLVDGRSASASELLAAALQDYHRAIIAGSSTFGKATSQRIFSLNPKNEKPATDRTDGAEHGVATVTIEKIYRATGRSVQGTGVQPDILLPGLYDGVLIHEADLLRALPQDSVVAKVPFKQASPLPLELLKAKSLARIGQNSWFSATKRLNKNVLGEIEKERDFVSLDWNKFLNSPLISAPTFPRHPGSAIASITVPAFDLPQMQRNPYERENNERWIGTLRDDEYVTEAYFLLDDYLSILNSRK